jgi:hypothetical protein
MMRGSGSGSCLARASARISVARFIRQPLERHDVERGGGRVVGEDLRREEREPVAAVRGLVPVDVDLGAERPPGPACRTPGTPPARSGASRCS